MRAEWEMGGTGKPSRVWGEMPAQNWARSLHLTCFCSFALPQLPPESEQKEQPTGQKPTLKNDEL